MQNIAGSKRTISLNKIRLDGDTQSRLSLDENVIHEYSALMEAGQEFPPLLVVFDGADYWLVDGFHRRWAAIKTKLEKLKCLVVEGTRETARWMSYAVNKDHGLPRTNEDKKKAVIAALKHPQGTKKSDTAIAEHVGVDVKTVGKYRAQIQSTMEIPESTERTGRDGRTINTANIGKTKSEPVEAMPLPTRPTQPEPREVSPVERAFTEKTPYEQLCYWWEKADSAGRTRFRNFIDGIN